MRCPQRRNRAAILRVGHCNVRDSASRKLVVRREPLKMNVILALTALVGSSSAALSNVMTPVPAPRFDVRLVVDGDPLLASAGISYGTNSLLPGPGATAVGITAMARVTAFGTLPNYGVFSTFSGNAMPSNPIISTFSHNDSLSDQVRPSLWTSPSLAFQRGLSRFDGAGNVLSGTYGVVSAPGANGGARADFRALLPSPQIQNSPSTNNTNPQPSLQPYNPQSYAVNGHGNGWIGVPDRALGNFSSRPGSAAILSAYVTRSPIADDGTETDPFVNYANHDQDLNAPGAQSPWYALYHFVFVPRSGGDPTRDVTVSWSGIFMSYAGESRNLFGNWSLAPQTIIPQNPYSSLYSYLPDVSVTFTVPTPSALGLLSLGALISTRRRR